jgi:hypothetical protein
MASGQRKERHYGRRAFRSHHRVVRRSSHTTGDYWFRRGRTGRNYRFWHCPIFIRCRGQEKEEAWEEKAKEVQEEWRDDMQWLLRGHQPEQFELRLMRKCLPVRDDLSEWLMYGPEWHLHQGVLLQQ